MVLENYLKLIDKPFNICNMEHDLLYRSTSGEKIPAGLTKCEIDHIFIDELEGGETFIIALKECEEPRYPLNHSAKTYWQVTEEFKHGDTNSLVINGCYTVLYQHPMTGELLTNIACHTEVSLNDGDVYKITCCYEKTNGSIRFRTAEYYFLFAANKAFQDLKSKYYTVVKESVLPFEEE